MQVRHNIRRAAGSIALILATSAGLVTSGALASGAQAATPTFHNCAVMGTSGGNQAVHCADIFTSQDDSIWVRNELYCQRAAAPHQLVACHGIIEQLAYGGPGFTHGFAVGSCGAIANKAGCGAVKALHEAVIGELNLNSSRTCTRWGESVRDSIEMPGSTTTYSSNVIATSHFTYPC